MGEYSVDLAFIRGETGDIEAINMTCDNGASRCTVALTRPQVRNLRNALDRLQDGNALEDHS